MDDTWTGTDTNYGRSFIAHAKGATVDALELNAFEQARAYFGPEPKLIRAQQYTARRADLFDRPSYFHAQVMIVEVLDEGPS